MARQPSMHMGCSPPDLHAVTRPMRQMVDLSSHNTNPPGVFDGEAVPISDVAEARIDLAVAALRKFLADRGQAPTADSWTAAGMRPSDKTIRRRFGSFKTAVAAVWSGLDNK